MNDEYLYSLLAEWGDRFLDQLTDPALDLTPGQHWARLARIIRSDGYPLRMAVVMADAMMKAYFPDWERKL
jgi:hypothetical protein